MKPFSVIFSRGHQHTVPMTSRLSRSEVCPPSLRCSPSSAWQRLMFWLVAPAPHDASPPLNRLPVVRHEFERALADIDEAARYPLVCRIGAARSLRDLWHMRLDVYNLVALKHSEFEAGQRLALLNRHFPTRAPRSGFAPLTS
jgi:hypothetical protein